MAGVYVPPHRARAAAAAAASAPHSSPEFQRAAWDALRKSLNGLVNKVNASNMAHVLPELFHENLVRGRGLFVKCLMRAQATSPAFTPVYAALIAVVNTKLPEVGELLVRRVALHLRRAYRRSQKMAAVALSKFVAHLVNQGVAHEILALQLLALLLEAPTDDSVEVAVAFTRECGAALSVCAPASLHAVFERFRVVLQEGAVEARVQYQVETLFAARKAKFAEQPPIPPGLDVVEDEDRIAHEVGLDDEDLDGEEGLDVWRFDENWDEGEAAWAEVRREILGDGEEEEAEEGGGRAGGAGEGAGARAGGGAAAEEGEEEEDHEGAVVVEGDFGGEGAAAGGGGGGGSGAAGAAYKTHLPPGGGAGFGGSGAIVDLTQTDLINLRRTIYLTIMSSLDFEECVHKLMKVAIPKGYEGELAHMVVECCSQEKTYLKYYGLLGGRFCMIARPYQDAFAGAFKEQYAGCHRLENNKLRNVAKLFAHLLYADALPWAELYVVRINEDESNPATRIFMKVVFQELVEYMGLPKLRARVAEPGLAVALAGMFPRDNLRHTRFAVNFFTSIGLGALTDELRDFLKKQQQAAASTVAAVLQ